MVILLSFLVLLGIGLLGPGYLVSLSHIQANVPSQGEFDEILLRDLQTYFQNLKGKQVRVEYEFLRRGPTQVGVAYPKFYLWVKVYEGTTLIDEGAVRIATIERTHIEVTHYLSKSEIRANPDQIYYIFPKAVCEKILERLNK